MPLPRPVLLFAFANDAQASLALADEQTLTQRIMKEWHDGERMEYRALGHPKFSDLYQSLLDLHNRVAIFHFGGHSNKQALQLRDKAGQAQSLATFLGQQSRLKLVFLNGCSNKAQVKLLLEAGVPAVIATNAPVGDARAVKFSEAFYRALAAGQSLGHAFDSAEAVVKNDHDFNIVKRDAGSFGDEEAINFPWGLYYQDEAVLDLTLEELAKANKLEMLASLRAASRERYLSFTDKGKGGRFERVRIDDAILAGIEGIPTTHQDFIDETVALDEKPGSLLDSLPRLWGEDCPHTLITGAGGMGKTVSLLRLWDELSSSNDPLQPVPIFIQLNEFNQDQKPKFIERYIQEWYASDWAEEESKQLKKKIQCEANQDNEGHKIPHLVLLLDGFNEVTSQSNELLLEILRLKALDQYPGLQLVLTSRTDSRANYQWQAFHLLELQALTNDQIATYLGEGLLDNPALLELLGNPMMLNIYTVQHRLPQEYLDTNYLIKDVTSAGEMLYNVEMIQRIKVEKQHQGQQEQLRRRFVLEYLLPYLAWKMQKAGLFYLEEKSLDESIDLLGLLMQVRQELINSTFFREFEDFRSLGKAFLEGLEDWELQQELIEKIAIEELVLLVKQNNSSSSNNYGFLHQNFRDYFAARHVQNQIDKALKAIELPTVLKQAPLDFYIRQLLGELEGEHVNKMGRVEGKWQWSEGEFFLSNSRLTKMLNACRGIYDEEKLGYAVWNLLTIWKEQRGELSGADLSQLDLSRFFFNSVRTSRPGLSALLFDVRIGAKNLFSKGHSGAVHSVTFSPDGQHILSSSEDATLKLWDAATGECLRTFEGHSDEVVIVAFSPNGRRILSGSSDGDGTLKLWDAATGECLRTFETKLNGIESVAFSPDGQRILSGDWYNTLKLWDVTSGECLNTVKYSTNGIGRNDFSPDGRRYLLSFVSLVLFDTASGYLRTFEGHKHVVTIAAFSLDGQRILSGDREGTLKLWDAETGECLRTFETKLNGIESVAFSPDGRRILSGDREGTLKLWDAATGECLRIFEGHSEFVSSVTFSPDERRILSGSYDHTLKLWDANSGECLRTIGTKSNGVKSVAFSPDGRRILSGSQDATLKLWDAASSTCLLIFAGHSSRISSVAFSPDGQRILSGSQDATLKLWDAASGKCLRTFAEHSSGVTSLAFSPDGRHILSGSEDKTLKLWNVTSGTCLRTFSAERAGSVRSVAFSPNEQRILSGDWKGRLKVWDVTSGSCLNTFFAERSRSVSSVAFSPDGQRILSGSQDSALMLWDAASDERLFGFYSGHGVTSVAFSPDGQRILSGGEDTLKLWDAASGEWLRTFEGHSEEVTSVAFSPDGQRILSGSQDKTLKLWDTASGECLLIIPDTPSLLVQGCEFRILRAVAKRSFVRPGRLNKFLQAVFPRSSPNAIFSQKEISLLRQYGAIFNDKDAERWAALMEKHGMAPP